MILNAIVVGFLFVQHFQDNCFRRNKIAGIDEHVAISNFVNEFSCSPWYIDPGRLVRTNDTASVEHATSAVALLELELGFAEITYVSAEVVFTELNSAGDVEPVIGMSVCDVFATKGLLYAFGIKDAICVISALSSISEKIKPMVF